MDRSLSRLRELNEIMSQYEAQAGWQHGGESIDAAATLQRDFTTTRDAAPGPPAPRTPASLKIRRSIYIPHMRRLIILGLSPNRFLKSFENWKMSSYPTRRPTSPTARFWLRSRYCARCKRCRIT